MRARWTQLVAGASLSLVLGACGGGGDDRSSAAGQSNASSTSTSPSSTTTSTPALIEGVETYDVEAGHSQGPVSYPQVPPVGGIHHPSWMPCGYYDEPVPNERAVHSLEHGAIWITHRPDLARPEVDVLAGLARGRDRVLVSPWGTGLPSPIVATAWGRQLQLESTDDPRLLEFVDAYANQGPEPDAPC